MVQDRLSLHNLFLAILGLPYVYFQPPSTLKMQYPCIIYKLDDIEGVHANDKRYLNMKRYLVTVVDMDPDTIIPDKILTLPYCSFEDHFVADNLNHYVCSLYY
jgi:hypothetical protein